MHGPWSLTNGPGGGDDGDDALALGLVRLTAASTCALAHMLQILCGVASNEIGHKPVRVYKLQTRRARAGGVVGPRNAGTAALASLWPSSGALCVPPGACGRRVPPGGRLPTHVVAAACTSVGHPRQSYTLSVPWCHGRWWAAVCTTVPGPPSPAALAPQDCASKAALHSIARGRAWLQQAGRWAAAAPARCRTKLGARARLALAPAPDLPGCRAAAGWLASRGRNNMQRVARCGTAGVSVTIIAVACMRPMRCA